MFDTIQYQFSSEEKKEGQQLLDSLDYFSKEALAEVCEKCPRFSFSAMNSHNGMLADYGYFASVDGGQTWSFAGSNASDVGFFLSRIDDEVGETKIRDISDDFTSALFISPHCYYSGWQLVNNDKPEYFDTADQAIAEWSKLHTEQLENGSNDISK